MKWCSGAVIALTLSACAGAAEDDTLPTPDPLTPAQAEALIKQELDKIWATTGLPETQRPTVERERLVQPHERGAVISQCMRDDGFDVVEDGGGIRINHGSDEQIAPSALSRYVCEARIPVVPTFNAPLNESQLRHLYRYLTTELRECLAERGVELSDPPSKEHFIENYARNGGGWVPFEEVPASRFAELEAACPQSPAGLSR